jgi:hypothetical protein
MLGDGSPTMGGAHQAEVHHDEALSIIREHEVGGLNIPVNKGVFVKCVDAIGCAGEEESQLFENTSVVISINVGNGLRSLDWYA